MKKIRRDRRKDHETSNSKTNKTEGFSILIFKFLPLAVVTLLPILITTDHWRRVWNGGLPRAWDGTGHYAVAQIYADRIFPDTFGWIDNFFAGMPFPNFYPPLFYWLIALLSKLGIFSFLDAFKIVVCLPIILMPAAIWFLAWKISEKNRVIATLSSLICVWLLIDYRFASAAFPLGLDYFSTFQIGLYAQPLGFILLLAWLFVFQKETLNHRKIGVASILLALVILANFFCAITACFFVFARFINNLIEFVLKKISLAEFRQKTFSHLAIPILAVCLSAFWLVPMLNQSKYFVTRPTQVSLFPSPLVWLFYALAFLGCVSWLRRQSAGRFYVIACLCLVFFIFFVSPIAPGWFPFQTNRFLANLNFLLCLPVAFLLSFAFEKITQAVPAKTSFVNLKKLKFAGLFLVVGFSFFLIESPKYELSFYSDKEFNRIKPIFDFAQNNSEGRYLVENPDPNYPLAQLDGRAINSYLGVQGNTTASIVFRESSSMSLFFNPLVSVFSAHPENYGISSILADDLDFKDQSIEKHIARARFLGVRYFVIISPWIKEKLISAGLSENKFGGWSIFEITQARSSSQDLAYKPALVVSDFSLKARKSSDFSFLRLVEEQFNDAWFDVLLAHNPQNNKIDKLTNLEMFRTIIVEKYEYDNEDKAFDILKTYSQKNSVILLDSGDDLLKRIKIFAAEFGNLEIIEYPIEKESHQLMNEFSKYQYNSSEIRSVWKRIKDILENNKVEANSSDLNITNRTFHPNWQSLTIKYISTPFFSLTALNEVELPEFKRDGLEVFGFWLSIVSILLCFLLIFNDR